MVVTRRKAARRSVAVAGGLFGVALLLTDAALADESELDPTVGYNYGEIEIPRHTGTAGAQRALSSSIGALFANPANIAVGRVYHLGAFVQLWPEANRQSYGAAASDSLVSSTRAAGALGITQNFQDPDGIDRKWTDLRVALAFPFSDQLYFGLGGRYLWLSQGGNGPLGTSYASGGLAEDNIVQSFSVDAGATLKPVNGLSLSVVGSNLTNPGHGFFPTSVAGAIGFGQEQFAIEGDVVADFTTWEDTRLRAMFGLEALLAQRLALRGGYRYDRGAESHALSLGVGYIDRSFLLDVGARRTVSGETATTLVLGFTYHLEATGMAQAPSDSF